MTHGDDEGAWLVGRIAKSKSDTLNDIYAFQAWYQEQLGYEIGGIENARRNVLYAFAELAELLDELPWRWHRKGQPPVDKGALVGEFADLLVFLMNVLLHCGVTDAELRRGISDTLAKNLGRLDDGTNIPG